MFKVNNRNTRTRCEICSKLIIKTPERRSHIFVSGFEMFDKKIIRKRKSTYIQSQTHLKQYNTHISNTQNTHDYSLFLVVVSPCINQMQGYTTATHASVFRVLLKI